MVNDEEIGLSKKSGLREEVWRIIFQHDTMWAKYFDVVLLWLIAASVAVVMLESVEPLAAKHSKLFHILEWIFTIVFTISRWIGDAVLSAILPRITFCEKQKLANLD